MMQGMQACVTEIFLCVVGVTSESAPDRSSAASGVYKGQASTISHESYSSNRAAENNMCYRDRRETINCACLTTHSNIYESTHPHEV